MDFRKIPLSCIRDTPDPRDFRKFSAAPPIPLPETFDIPAQPEIRNQGQSNACTGFAAAWMWEQCLRSRGMLEDVSLSAKYLWYWSRFITGDQSQDTGCQIRNVMKALKECGSCPVDEWPDGSSFDVEPNETSKVWGQALTLPSYERCESIQAIKYALAIEQQAVVIGLPIYEAWYSELVRKTGIIPARMYLGNLVGWHAMALCGFTRERFILANSWSTSWGAHGFAYIPFEYLSYEETSELPGYDAWTPGFLDVPPPQESPLV